MKYLRFLLLVTSVSACSSLGCTGHVQAAERPNVLFIAVDDLRADSGALLVKDVKTPQLDSFAKTARVFNRHYVQVPTCGASRCALVRGRYPTQNAHVGNNGIASTQADWGTSSLPATFRQQGYRTLALGKITHYPGGLTGKGWAEGPEELLGAWDRCWIPDGPWKNAEAIMHGYANGVARRPGQSPAWEAHEGPDEAYPDAWVAAEAAETLMALATQEQPWFFSVGFFKPHLPFAAPKKWHDLYAGQGLELDSLVAAKPAWPSGWHGSGEFRNNYGHPAGRDPESDVDYARHMRAAYAASVSYMDAQVGRVLQALQDSGAEQNTIVVVWSDHGFLLGEHAIWGKHCLYENALHSTLMIRHPGLPQPGEHSSAIVETIDIFPTLTDLCGLTNPPELDGRSLRSQLDNPQASTKQSAYSFWSGGKRTVRTDRWRLIVHPRQGDSPHLELFDYQQDPQETHNHIFDHPDLAQALLIQLQSLPSPFADSNISTK